MGSTHEPHLINSQHKIRRTHVLSLDKYKPPYANLPPIVGTTHATQSSIYAPNAALMVCANKLMPLSICSAVAVTKLKRRVLASGTPA